MNAGEAEGRDRAMGAAGAAPSLIAPYGAPYGTTIETTDLVMWSAAHGTMALSALRSVGDGRVAARPTGC